jgi:prevent-host-death family protein
MKAIGAYEAKTHFSRLLDEAAKGECVEFTKNGVAVAWLVPPPHQRQVDFPTVIQEVRELRRGVTLGDLSLRAMIAEGRKG